MPAISKQSPKPVARKVGGSVIDRIAPIGFDEDEGLKVLLYGKSGTGKTTLAATFPGDSLWIILSGGKRPGELRSVDTPQNRKKIKQVQIQSTDELKQVIKYLEEKDPFRTVVLDHVTGLQDKVLAEILNVEELPEQKAWGTASQQQYGQCTAQCKEYLKRLLGLKGNVIIIGQERAFNTDDESSEVLQPFVSVALTPSLAGWLPPSCDYVCQTYIRQKTEARQQTLGTKTRTIHEKIDGVEYMLRTAPHETYAGKFRVPKGRELPPSISDPSYDKIIKLING